MLCVSLKIKEKLLLMGLENVTIYVSEVRGRQVRVAIEAPREVRIERQKSSGKVLHSRTTKSDMQLVSEQRNAPLEA